MLATIQQLPNRVPFLAFADKRPLLKLAPIHVEALLCDANKLLQTLFQLLVPLLGVSGVAARLQQLQLVHLILQPLLDVQHALSTELLLAPEPVIQQLGAVTRIQRYAHGTDLAVVGISHIADDLICMGPYCEIGPGWDSAVENAVTPLAVVEVVEEGNDVLFAPILHGVSKPLKLAERKTRKR